MPSTSPFLSLCSPVRNFSFLSSIHGRREEEAGSTEPFPNTFPPTFPFFLSFFFPPIFSSVIVAFDSPLGLDRSNYHPWTRFMLVLSPSPLSLSLSLSLSGCDSIAREKSSKHRPLHYLRHLTRTKNSSRSNFEENHSRIFHLPFIRVCESFAVTFVRMKIRSYLSVSCNNNEDRRYIDV